MSACGATETAHFDISHERSGEGSFPLTGDTGLHDFRYRVECSDSGTLPAKSGILRQKVDKTLVKLGDARISAYPRSGEINY
jgi:hypothetical protein